MNIPEMLQNLTPNDKNSLKKDKSNLLHQKTKHGAEKKNFFDFLNTKDLKILKDSEQDNQLEKTIFSKEKKIDPKKINKAKDLHIPSSFKKKNSSVSTTLVMNCAQQWFQIDENKKIKNNEGENREIIKNKKKNILDFDLSHDKEKNIQQGSEIKKNKFDLKIENNKIAENLALNGEKKEKNIKNLKVFAQKIKKNNHEMSISENINKNKNLNVGDIVAFKADVKSYAAPKIHDVTFISQKKQGDLQTLRLQLHPHDLGKVDVKMHMSPSRGLQVTITAEQTNATALLLQDKNTLKQIMDHVALSQSHKITILVLDKNTQVVTQIHQSDLNMNFDKDNQNYSQSENTFSFNENNSEKNDRQNYKEKTKLEAKDLKIENPLQKSEIDLDGLII